MIAGDGVDALERGTRRYYDAEEGREARAIDPRRIEARDRFVDRVRSRPTVGRTVEIGTGPGRDAKALREAGLDVVGLDLLPGHAERAAANGVTMAVASARALPLATGSVGALWSMSTLMHIPAVAIEPAMVEIGRVLTPGATVAIGVWGGPDIEHDDQQGEVDGRRRIFSRRSEALWRELLAALGTIDELQVWTDDRSPDDWTYQLAFLTALTR